MDAIFHLNYQEKDFHGNLNPANKHAITIEVTKDGNLTKDQQSFLEQPWQFVPILMALSVELVMP